jgi:hypothetical protein
MAVDGNLKNKPSLYPISIRSSRGVSCEAAENKSKNLTGVKAKTERDGIKAERI